MPRALLITAGLAAVTLFAAPARAAEAADCTWSAPPCPSTAQPCES